MRFGSLIFLSWAGTRSKGRHRSNEPTWPRATAAGKSNAPLCRGASMLIQKKPFLPYSPLWCKSVAGLGLSRWGISWSHKCHWHHAEESDCLGVTIWLSHHKNVTHSLQETVKMWEEKENIGHFSTRKNLSLSVDFQKKHHCCTHTHVSLLLTTFVTLSHSLSVSLSFTFLNLCSCLSVENK